MKYPFTLEWPGSLEVIRGGLNLTSCLEEWQHAPGWITELREAEGAFWLSCLEVGAIRFNLAVHHIVAYPKDLAHLHVFEQIFAHEWLPLVYQAWGIQVLHTSAAVRCSSGQVVAFAGPSGAGKSTLGYGLGHRPGWLQVADESLALQVEGSRVSLVKIPNHSRLRPASMVYYKDNKAVSKQLTWPDGELRLAAVFFLEPQEPDKNPEARGEIVPLDGADAYPFFLKQAFALTLKGHPANQRLMQDYLLITRQVPAFRLVFGHSFPSLETILDTIESWAQHG